MKNLLLAMVAAMANIAPAAAQTVESDFQSWNAIALSGPIAEESRVLAWFDGHARFRDDASDLGVTIIRPGIGYRVNSKLDVWTGYARVVSRSYGRPDIKENRIWQQATYALPELLGGKLSGRSRLEQRFRPTGDDTGWRFRQFVRWARLIENTDFSFVVWDEVFLGINDTDWGQRDGFDQNRLFVGAAWQLNERFRLEGGYLNNILDTPLGRDQTNHNISLTLFTSL